MSNSGLSKQLVEHAEHYFMAPRDPPLWLRPTFFWMVRPTELLLEFVTQAFGGFPQGNPRLYLLFPPPVKSGAAKGLSWGFSCGPITMKDGHLSFVIGYLVGVTFADGRCSDWRIRYVLESGVQWLYTFILIKTKPKTANLPTTPSPKCPSPMMTSSTLYFFVIFSGSALGLLF